MSWVVALISDEASAIGLHRILGVLLSFACAAVAVALDAQNVVTERLGSLANRSVFKVCWGRAFIAVWGAFVAAVYLVILAFPKWATNTFGFDVSTNEIIMALIVGVSATSIVRSKFTRIGNIDVGAEWVYLKTRLKVLESVNQMRAFQREACLNAYGDPIIRNVNDHPNYFTVLRDHIRQLLPGKPDIEDAVGPQVTQLKQRITRLGQPTPNNVNYHAEVREILTGLYIDYFGPDDLDNWACGRLNIASPIPAGHMRAFWRCARTRY